MDAVSVTFTREELANLTALLDAAVKATGLQGARAALAILSKLETAVSNTSAPDRKPTKQ